MWFPLAFQVGFNYFQMIIVLKDRDFLFSLEVIGILMVISCIWPFKGATVNIGYCSSYFMNIGNIWNWSLCSLFVWMLVREGCHNWSKLLLIEYWLLYAWMYWPFSFQELRSQGAKEWHHVLALNICNISFRLAFPECGILYECISFSTSL